MYRMCESKTVYAKEVVIHYLDYYGLDTGYMLSFNFNQKKEQGVKRIRIGDRVLFEGTV